MLLRQHCMLLLFICVVTAPALSGQEGRAPVQQQPQPLPPALEQILEHWANASSRIEKLEGSHLRRVYDSVFEVERLSEGQFWYERPDKGRIDVKPTQVTQSMIDEREVPGAKVRRKQNGKPFDLVPGKPEKWVCDGVRVFEIDEDKKSAQVAQLPPNMQGTSIMDSPLPFLFGMPPEKAKERFHLSFSRPFDPKSGYAYITAKPKRNQDAASWSQADVILNLKNFLPHAIQLKDPPGTGITVYAFQDLKVNPTIWSRKPTTWFTNFFQPDLRGYNVVNIDANAPQRPPGAQGDKIAGRNPPAGRAAPLAPVVQNYQRVHYKEAVAALEQMGLKKDQKQILLKQGSPARDPEDIYKVERQQPAPGTKITRDTVVELYLYTKPAR